MESDEAPTIEQYLELVRQLLENWQQTNQRPEVEVRRGRTVVDYPVLHGLTAHVHRMAAAALSLADVGMLTESLPLVRSAFECAVTAGWASHFEDGVVAISKESLRQRRGTLQRLQQLDPTREDAEGNVAAGKAIDAMEVSLDGRPRRFDLVCADLVGGSAAYVQYRLLSAQVHATVSCAEQYLVDVDGDPRLHLSLTSKTDLHRVASALLVGSMVWARQALLMHEKAVGQQGKFLREAASRGQVRLKLDLTEAAAGERGKAAYERRKARRSGGSSSPETGSLGRGQAPSA